MVEEHFGINIVEFMVRVFLVFVSVFLCKRLTAEKSASLYIGGGTHSNSARIRRADDGYCNVIQ